jgi:hypothetical protein
VFPGVKFHVTAWDRSLPCHQFSVKNKFVITVVGTLPTGLILDKDPYLNIHCYLVAREGRRRIFQYANIFFCCVCFF